MKKHRGNGQKRNDLLVRGKKILAALEPALRRKFNGRIIAIEVASGEYGVGQDELEAARAVRQKFPHKKFAFFRIGYPAAHKLRRGKDC